MNRTVLGTMAVALIISSPTAFAQGSSEKAPGQEMQNKGSVSGSLGASG